MTQLTNFECHSGIFKSHQATDLVYPASSTNQIIESQTVLWADGKKNEAFLRVY